MMLREESLMTIGEFSILKNSIFFVCLFLPALPVLLRQIPVEHSSEQIKAQWFDMLFEGAAWSSG